MTSGPDKDAAIEAAIQAAMLAEGKDALQKLDKESGGGRGGSTNDLDNSPGGPN